MFNRSTTCSIELYTYTFVCCLDTHALVRFLEEQSTAIVPIARVQEKETLEYGGSCAVKWRNKKVYKGFLIYSGIYIYVRDLLLKI